MGEAATLDKRVNGIGQEQRHEGLSPFCLCCLTDGTPVGGPTDGEPLAVPFVILPLARSPLGNGLYWRVCTVGTCLC